MKMTSEKHIQTGTCRSFFALPSHSRYPWTLTYPTLPFSWNGGLSASGTVCLQSTFPLKYPCYSRLFFSPFSIITWQSMREDNKVSRDGGYCLFLLIRPTLFVLAYRLARSGAAHRANRITQPNITKNKPGGPVQSTAWQNGPY